MARRSRRLRKKTVLKLVENRDWEGLRFFAREESDTGPLILSLAFDLDDGKRWTAIDALGQWSAATAEDGDIETVRNIIRRVLWLMNDESGGLAWHGPEIIGEILARAPELISEFGRIVASSIHEDPFGPGAHWAIARLVPIAPDAFEGFVDDVRLAVNSSDPVERAYSLRSLAVLRPGLAQKQATKLQDDHAEVWGFDPEKGEPFVTTVAKLAREILDLEAAA